MTSLAAAGARGGVATVASQVFNIVVRTVAIIVFGRIFAPEVFGYVAVVTSINMFVTAIVALGLPAAAMQAKDLSDRAASALLFINVAIGAICAALFILGASFIGSLFGSSEIEVFVYWLAAVPFLMGLQSQFRVQMMRYLMFTSLAVIEVVGTVVGTTIAVLYALISDSYIAIAVQALAPVCIQTALVVIYARWLPRLPGNYSEVRGLLIIGIQAFGMGFLQHASRQLLVPAIALHASPADVGAYDRAQQLAVVPVNGIIDQLQRVAIPVLAQLRDDSSRMLAYLARAQLVISYTVATGFFVLASIANDLIVFLLGANWAPAGPLLQLLAVGAAFRALAQTIQWQFIAQGATRAGLIFSLWSQPTVAVVSILGLIWGIEGVALLNSVAWAAMWPAATFAVARASNFNASVLVRGPLRALLLFALPAAAPGLLLSITTLPPIVVLPLSLIFAVAVCGVSYRLFSHVKSDVRDVVQVMRLSITRSA